MRLGETDVVVVPRARVAQKADIAIRPTIAARPRFVIDEEAKAARNRLDEARADKKAELALADRQQAKSVQERNQQDHVAEKTQRVARTGSITPARPAPKGPATDNSALASSAKLAGTAAGNPVDGTLGPEKEGVAGSKSEEAKSTGTETEPTGTSTEPPIQPGQPQSVKTAEGAAADGDRDDEGGSDPSERQGNAQSGGEAGGGDGTSDEASPVVVLQPQAPSPVAVAVPPSAPVQAGSPGSNLSGSSAVGEASSGVQGAGGSGSSSARLTAQRSESGPVGGSDDSDDPAKAATLTGESKATAIEASAPAGPLLAPAPTHASAAPPPVSGPVPHQGAPVPLGAVPMTIGLRSLAGSSHFEIRLDPVDLGRIDVRLDIDKERGTVTTRVVVERPETLALLQRDSHNLEQALSQAGLDPGAGISLSLSGDDPSGGNASSDRPSGGQQPDGAGRPVASASASPSAITPVAPRMLRGIAGIDIRI